MRPEAAFHRFVTVAVVLTVLALSVGLAAGPASAEQAANPRSGLQPIQPTRAMDTRRAYGGSSFGPESSRVLDLSWLPAEAQAVSLNITGVSPTMDTFVTVWPSGQARPDTSNLNLQAGTTRPNAVLVGLGVDRGVSLYNFAGDVDILVDVMGWYGEGFYGVTPVRAVDTRRNHGSAPLSTEQAFDVELAGRFGVPSGATAVAVNITAVNPDSQGFLTAWPAGRSRPDTSNLNFLPGSIVANLAVLGLGDSGAISVYNYGGTTDVLVDVMGWFDSSDSFEPAASPARLLDTRAGSCGFVLGPRETRNVVVAETSDIGAVALNVTAIDATAVTFLTVWPAGMPRPDASNLNIRPGQGAVPNLVTVGAGTAGEISIYNHDGYLEVLVDIFGSFPGEHPPGVQTPCPNLGGSQGGGLEYLDGLNMLDAQGVDRVAVWVCRVPEGSTNSFYRFYQDTTIDITPQAVVDLAQATTAQYFHDVSRGKYSLIFEPEGFIDLSADEGHQDCSRRAATMSDESFTNVLAVDNTTYVGGSAGPGLLSSNPLYNDSPLATSAAQSMRSVWIGGGTVNWECPAVITHEIGHTLHWPHSYIPGGSEYDNPYDVMSGSIAYSRRCQAQQTIAVNRLGAGWIDDSATFVHKFGASTLELTSPQSNDTEILLIVDEDEPGAFITAEARVGMGYDEGLQKEGVALHLVDQRLGSCGTPIAGGCLSLSRYQGQAVGQPYSSDHVIGVGESIGLAGITLTVDEGSMPGTFRVFVEGKLDLDQLN